MESKVIRLYKNREIKISILKVFAILSGIVVLAILFTWPLYNGDIYPQIMACVVALAVICMLLLFLRTGQLAKSISRAKEDVLKRLNADEIMELDDNFATGFRLGELVLAGRYLVSIALGNFFILHLRDVRKLYAGKKGVYLNYSVDCMFIEDTSGKKYNVVLKKKYIAYSDKFIEEAVAINRNIQARTGAGSI